MKTKTFPFFLTIVFSLMFLTNCAPNDSNDTLTIEELKLKEKELELKEKEIDLKERELALEDKTISNPQSSPNHKTEYKYEFDDHKSINHFWSDFQHALETNDKDAIIKMTKIPFVDFYEVTTGEKGLSSRTSSEFLSNLDLIFPSCARKEILKNLPIPTQPEEMTVEEIAAEAKYVFTRQENCPPNSPMVSGYVFGRENGYYKLIGLKFYP